VLDTKRMTAYRGAVGKLPPRHGQHIVRCKRKEHVEMWRTLGVVLCTLLGFACVAAPFVVRAPLPSDERRDSAYKPLLPRKQRLVGFSMAGVALTRDNMKAGHIYVQGPTGYQTEMTARERQQQLTTAAMGPGRPKDDALDRLIRKKALLNRGYVGDWWIHGGKGPNPKTGGERGGFVAPATGP